MDITQKLIAAADALRGLNPQQPKFEVLQETTPFLRSAYDVLKEIEEIRNFLVRHGPEALNTVFYRDMMSEEEKAQIEDQTKLMLQQCCCHIDHLKTLLGDNTDIPEEEMATYSHYQGVLTYLYSHLQSVTDLFSRQRALRLQSAKNQLWYQYHTHAAAAERLTHPTSEVNTKTSQISPPQSTKDVSTPHPEHNAVDVSMPVREAEEEQELKQANTMLQRKLEHSVDKIREVEKQVVEISHMQQLLEEKAVEQAADIDGLFQHASDASHNVIKGNEHMRAGLDASWFDCQMVVTIIILVVAFSLLFLHWINV